MKVVEELLDCSVNDHADYGMEVASCLTEGLIPPLRYESYDEYIRWIESFEDGWDEEIK